MSNKGQFYIERRSEGNYAVRRGGADRASAVEDTQAEAIARARKMDPACRFTSSASGTLRTGCATSGVSRRAIKQYK